MKKIRCCICEKCKRIYKHEEKFCPNCGGKIVERERDPEVEVYVEIEGYPPIPDCLDGGTPMVDPELRRVSMKEFFDIAKKKGLI